MPIYDIKAGLLLCILCSNMLINVHLRCLLQKEIIQGITNNMPTHLQDKSEFCILGYVEGDCSGNSELENCGNDRNREMKLNGNQSSSSLAINHGSWSCGCQRHDGILGQGRLSTSENMSIKLISVISERMDGRVIAIPKLDHLHFNGEIESQLDLHVCKSCSSLKQASFSSCFSYNFILLFDKCRWYSMKYQLLVVTIILWVFTFLPF